MPYQYKFHQTWNTFIIQMDNNYISSPKQTLIFKITIITSSTTINLILQKLKVPDGYGDAI